MKSALWLMCCSLGLGCSAAAPSAGGVSGAPAAASGAAGSAVGGGGSAGAPGAGGISTTGGNQPMGGAAGGAGSAGSNAGTTNGGGAESGGTAGSAGAGVGGASGCVPDPGGGFSIVGDTVHDSKTCLDWLKTTQAGVNYAAAEMFCGDATTGGFGDWRIPTASEFASTITLCGKYPPDGPTDPKFFDQKGDGYWTSTPAGEPNKVCAIGMADAGDYYHYGTAGPQVVRCVRGTGSVTMVKDCIVAMGCKTW